MRTLLWIAFGVTVLGMAACKKEEVTAGIPVLGNGQHTLESVSLTEVVEAVFNEPYDVAFHPENDSELWVVNHGSDEMVIFEDITSDRTPISASGLGSEHFFARPAALAFSDAATLATIHETDQITQSDTPEDFMGPTLWPADADSFDGGHASHLDMLHNSPNGVGIAADEGNAFWVVDGYHEAITRYDFHDDHGSGGVDHSDGEIARYVDGELSYVEGVPSHIAFDASSDRLYIADTGASRIAVLDTSSGDRGSNLSPNYDGVDQYEMVDAVLETFVDGSTIDLQEPSGIELYDGVLYVSDNATGIVYAIDADDGSVLDWLETGRDGGALMGLTVDDNGSLWIADGTNNRLVHIVASVPE